MPAVKKLPVTVQARLFAAGVVVAISLVQVASLPERAAPPLTAGDRQGAVEVLGVTDPAGAGGLKEGDRLLRWNGEPLLTADALEFSANLLHIGDRVAVTVVSGGIVRTAELVLVPAYQGGYWQVVTLIGLISIALGVFVLLAQPRDPAAGLLFWSLVSMGIVVMLAYEGLPTTPLGLAGSALFFFSYIGVAVCFCLFTLLFPRPIAAASVTRSLLLGVPGVLVTAATLFQYVRAAGARSITLFIGYDELYDVFHAAVLLYIAIGVVNIVRSYRSAATSADRRRLQWIAWGIAVGPAPFLLFSVIPQFFQPGGLVPELYTLPFLALIPFSFVVSFVRYRILDIELVIRRTTAYALVLVILLGLYLLLVAVVAAAVGTMTASAAAAVVVALLLEPLRSRIQRAVDRSFFRVQYDLRRTEKQMVEEIRATLDEAGLARLLVSGIAALIPLERIGMYAAAPPSGAAPRFLQGLGYPPDAAPALPASLLEACAPGLPAAREGVLEPEIPCVRGDASLLDRLGLALIVPMPSDAGTVVGLLALGRKRSGARFTPQDVDLLGMLGVQAGLALRRFALQRALFAEHAETQRLAALNQMKSDFVSYVSHELRTPLTSIKMFAELMASPRRGLDAKGKEYLAIIEGESDRLGHMVSTILDSARIEQGAKVYEMVDFDLRDAADAAMQAMQFQLSARRFAVRYVRPRRPLPVHGDPHAVADALANLIGNAVKYSAAVKRLRVRLARAGALALCTVQDRGIGIQPDALPHIFEKFYRDPGSSSRIQGIGLGLPLVKHIIDAHEGSITVESTPGKGSAFTLRLPLHRETSRHINGKRRKHSEHHSGH